MNIFKLGRATTLQYGHPKFIACGVATPCYFLVFFRICAGLSYQNR